MTTPTIPSLEEAIEAAYRRPPNALDPGRAPAVAMDLVSDWMLSLTVGYWQRWTCDNEDCPWTRCYPSTCRNACASFG